MSSAALRAGSFSRAAGQAPRGALTSSAETCFTFSI